MSKFPEHHHGMHYQQFLEVLSQKRPIGNYLEIGVQQGTLLSKITAKSAYAVDPGFAIDANVARNKKSLSLYQATSDEFFAEWSGPIDGNPLDFAFLDGLHTFEYLLRDFYNTESFSSGRTLIAMHDCLPITEFMADRDEREALKRGADTAYPYAWTGDVWKIIPILKKYRPDLSIVCVNAHPTGVVFVTNLDPKNTTLQDNYLKIVQEFSATPNNADGIAGMYDSVEIVVAEKIINGFDHSLYFRF
jgi:hypothetical protein